MANKDKLVLDVSVDGVSDIKNLSTELDNVGKASKKVLTPLQELKNEIKESKNALLTLEEGTQQYATELNKLAQAQFKIKDINDKARLAVNDFGQTSKNVAGVVQGMAGGFQLAQGTMALFGVENEAVLQTLLKLQSTMAITSGLGEMMDAYENAKDLIAGFKAMTIASTAAKNAATVSENVNTAATVVNTTALGVETVATEAQIVANETLTVSWLAALGPIALVVAAVGAVAAGIYYLIDSYTELTPAQEAAFKLQNDLNKAGVDGTKEIRTKIYELNTEYNVYLNARKKGDKELSDKSLSNIGNYVIKQKWATDEEWKLNKTKTEWVTNLFKLQIKQAETLAYNKAVFERKAVEDMKVANYQLDMDLKSAEEKRLTTRLSNGEKLDIFERSAVIKRRNELYGEINDLRAKQKVAIETATAVGRLVKTTSFTQNEAPTAVGRLVKTTSFTQNEAPTPAPKVTPLKAEDIKKNYQDFLTKNDDTWKSIIEKTKENNKLNEEGYKASPELLQQRLKRNKQQEQDNINEIENKRLIRENGKTTFDQELKYIYKLAEAKVLDNKNNIQNNKTLKQTLIENDIDLYKQQIKITDDSLSELAKIQFRREESAVKYSKIKKPTAQQTYDFESEIKEFDKKEKKITDITKISLDENTKLREKNKTDLININQEIIDDEKDKLKTEADLIVIGNQLRDEDYKNKLSIASTYAKGLSSLTDSISGFYDFEMELIQRNADSQKRVLEESTEYKAADNETRLQMMYELDQKTWEAQNVMFEKQKGWKIATVWLDYAAGLFGIITNFIDQQKTLGLWGAIASAAISTTALTVGAVTATRDISSQTLNKPSKPGGSSISSGGGGSSTAVNPNKSSLTTREENLNMMNNSSKSNQPIAVVKVSDINQVQNTVKVRENNSSY